MTSLSAKLGNEGEQLAADYYRRQGYKILARNYKLFTSRQLSEIDLIFKKKKEVVFVEVKTRSSFDFADPTEHIDLFKQRRLLQGAKSFLTKNPSYEQYNARFDIVIIKPDIDKNLIIDNIITDAIQDLT